MPNTSVSTPQEKAYAAAVEAGGTHGVGSIIESFGEGDGITTFLFESKLKGYKDWRWSVTVFQLNDAAEPTVSEVVLLPGTESLVAPDWVPWSERLADYKALQAELEAQAALDAAEAEDSDDVDSDDEADEDLDQDESDEVEVEDSAEQIADNVDAFAAVENSDVAEEDLAPADLEEGKEAEGDAKATRRKPPRFFGRRKRAAKDNARGKGKDPQN